MEKFEAPQNEKESSAAPMVGLSQIDAARHLEEIALKKGKDVREGEDRARLSEIQSEIKSIKIEPDFSKLEGAIVNPNRRGSLLAAESAHARETPEMKKPPVVRQAVKQAPSKRSWFDRFIGRDQ